MDAINSVGSLVSRMVQIENHQPSPSIADVVGNPNTPGPDTPDASEFTDKYELQALVDTFRTNAEMSLTLIQMFDDSRSRRS